MSKRTLTLEQDGLVKGNLWKNILLFSLPLILSNLLQVFFNISDIAVIGQFAGGDSLGGVGSSSTLVVMFTGFLLGFSNAVNVIVAKRLGQGNEESVRKAVHTGFLVCLFMGVIVCAAGLLACEPILRLMNTKEAFMDKAVLYCRVYFIGVPGLAVYDFANGTYSADGNTRTPLIFLAISGLLNVALNLIFVIVCKLDVLGVAMASAITTTLSAVLCMTALCRSKHMIRFSFKSLCIDKTSLKALFTIGISNGFQNSLFAISNLFIQSGVNTFSEIMVEGVAAAQNADALVWDSMAAFYMACSSFIGQNYGANNKKRVMGSYLISTLYSFALGAVLGVLLIIFAKPFLSIFTTDPEVVDAGRQRLIIMAFSYCFSALMDNSIAASRGLGKTVVPTIAVIIGSVIFRIAWIYTVFAYFKTVPSLFLLYIFSWLITAAFEIGYFLVIYKKTFKAEAK